MKKKMMKAKAAPGKDVIDLIGDEDYRAFCQLNEVPKGIVVIQTA
jgi:hypothetical protein